MRLKDILHAEKTVVDWGKWERGSRLKKTAFPLSRSSSFRPPASWQRRVVQFDALNYRCRLLVAFDVGKEEYRAWLAVERGQDQILLARLEFHGSHVGWHCHTICRDRSGDTSGVVKGFGDTRYPSAGSYHRRKEFDITELTALSKACKFFRIPAEVQGELFN